MSCSGSSNIGETEEEADAEEKCAIDQSPSESLPVLRHAGGYEDVGNVICDVDAESGTEHSREDIGPVIGVFGDDCEEEDRESVANAGDEQKNGSGKEMQEQTADYGEDKAACSHGCVPCGCQ